MCCFINTTANNALYLIGIRTVYRDINGGIVEFEIEQIVFIPRGKKIFIMTVVIIIIADE